MILCKYYANTVQILKCSLKDWLPKCRLFQTKCQGNMCPREQPFELAVLCCSSCWANSWSGNKKSWEGRGMKVFLKGKDHFESMRERHKVRLHKGQKPATAMNSSNMGWHSTRTWYDIERHGTTQNDTEWRGTKWDDTGRYDNTVHTCHNTVCVTISLCDMSPACGPVTSLDRSSSIASPRSQRRSAARGFPGRPKSRLEVRVGGVSWCITDSLSIGFVASFKFV